MKKSDREFRSVELLNFNENENLMTVTGKAIVYNQRQKVFEIDGNDFYEEIDKDALNGADLSDVIFNINHEGRPVARLRNKTLHLENKEDGLYIKADLSGTELGRSLYEEIKGGYITQMSFAFTVKEQSYNRETRTRTILKIGKVYDVSAVNTPAYEGTTLEARSFFELEYSKELKALEQADLQEKRNNLLERIKNL